MRRRTYQRIRSITLVPGYPQHEAFFGSKADKNQNSKDISPKHLEEPQMNTARSLSTISSTSSIASPSVKSGARTRRFLSEQEDSFSGCSSFGG